MNWLFDGDSTDNDLHKRNIRVTYDEESSVDQPKYKYCLDFSKYIETTGESELSYYSHWIRLLAATEYKL
jgi:hypothetical protein